MRWEDILRMLFGRGLGLLMIGLLDRLKWCEVR